MLQRTEGDGLEKSLLAAVINSREAYEILRGNLTEKDVSVPVGFWLRACGIYYRGDSAAQAIESSWLQNYLDARLPYGKQRDTYAGVVRDLPEAPSPANIAVVALAFLRRQAAMDLAQAIVAADRNKEEMARERYNRLAAADRLERVTGHGGEPTTEASGIRELFEQIAGENLIRISPERINSRISGGMLPGQHAIAFGRPEAGKTAFGIEFAVGTALLNPDRHVLYCSNEDQINITKSRAVSRLTGMTLGEMREDPDKAISLYTDRGGEACLHFVQLHHAGISDLSPLMDRFDASVVVLDQIRNVATTADAGYQALEEAGQQFRELLVSEGAIGLSITQAGVDRRVLGMEDMYGSKTGLPGTADLIIGIGQDRELQANKQRLLSFPKNKLSSEDGSRDALLVDVNLSLSQFK